MRNNIYLREVEKAANLKAQFAFNKFLLILLILFGQSLVFAQLPEIKLKLSVQNPFDDVLFAETEQETGKIFPEKEKISTETEPETPAKIFTGEIRQERSDFELLKTENEWCFKLSETKKDSAENPISEDDSSQKKKNREKFHWKPALIQSGIFLGIQHGFRLMQEKTYSRLGGPFFRDWGQSVKALRGWKDGDSVFINYVAHPLQGGFTGRIFINNSDKSKRQEFGKSKEYWESRFKAFVWSAAWSTQFELGPISEASIGNVGTFEKNGHSTTAWVDLVITPIVGTGVVIGEDALDKYVLKKWLEKKTGDQVTTKIKIWRSLLTPTLTLSNLIGGKPPWKRYNR